MTSAMTLIEHYEVPSGGQAIIDFTSIPTDGTYTDLMILGSLRDESTNDFFDLRFNNSSSGFSSRWILGNGSSASSSSRTDQYNSATVVKSTYTANTFSNFQIYIPNYAGSQNKSYSIDTVMENNATESLMEIIAGLWSNTAAINQITFRIGASSSDAAEFSSISLYGITAGSDGVTSVS